ncbi:MAG: MOP flippase family protein [Moorea sp. SIO4A1]|uniref:MOP flippase family protein n=1 Tax=Moorena sp. SIO4A1 TaxID=2607835 RepID=UPI00144E9563|nr:MOP flippase family protein [Moorena sp. SIO4A1]NEQ62192.1 MOP flippase family protein [Moorena sp. SIO4A1]
MSLKRVATSGVKWSLVSQVGRQVMQFVTTAILARLLSPSDFGLLGMAMIVIAFIDLFKDLGTSSAVIQRKNISDALLHSLFWINVALGILGIFVIFVISPLAASFYQEPRVTSVLRFLSLNFFISGISILQKAILEKNLAFNTLAKIEICAIVSASFVGIGSALLGFGVWSLVYQSLVLVTVTTVMLWAATSWRPKMIFDWSEVKDVSSYSLNLTAASIWRYFKRNADYLLIGRVLGSQDLGYYTLAYRIMLYPLQNISHVIARVMFPVFSQIQDDNAKFRSAYLKVIGLIALISFPMMVGLWVAAEPFVLTLLGSQWQPVILLLMILAPVGMEQSLGTTVGTIYKAKGRPDLQFRWGIVSGILILTAFVIGLQWGIVGVAVAYVIASFLWCYPSFNIPFSLIHLRMRDFGAVLWRPLVASLLMLLVLVGLKFLLPTGLGSGWVLGILIPIGGISYLLASWCINREQIQQLLVMVGLNK